MIKTGSAIPPSRVFGGPTVPPRPVIGIATQTLDAIPGKLLRHGAAS